MSEFKFDVSEHNGAPLAKLGGPLNFENSAALLSHLNELGAKYPRLVYLDLSGLTFLPSQAMGHLVQFRNSLKPVNGRVVLVGTPPRIYDSMFRAHLEKLFEFKNKLETAPPPAG